MIAYVVRSSELSEREQDPLFRLADKYQEEILNALHIAFPGRTFAARVEPSRENGVFPCPKVTIEEVEVVEREVRLNRVQRIIRSLLSTVSFSEYTPTSKKVLVTRHIVTIVLAFMANGDEEILEGKVYYSHRDSQVEKVCRNTIGTIRQIFDSFDLQRYD